MTFDSDFVKEVVTYYNSNRSTVRKTAQHFGICKATVHKYLTVVMPNHISREILDYNKSVRSSRGGLAKAAKNKK